MDISSCDNKNYLGQRNFQSFYDSIKQLNFRYPFLVAYLKIDFLAKKKIDFLAFVKISCICLCGIPVFKELLVV